ncbi:NHLP bacteriocin system secretion protein [Legionella quateirensis]|uniref:Branched-chain alpha-keto acid dehydrogenase subunit E2 n=1 Tax=Legionella quateirensis TaxID=45072 RepID=A0A378KSW4_9GAMM|nr:NHLP bacteriocin system secretion protein [Legionella quateirensis]KTD51080.1 branched-chain alpha-keto acid dehydrogenase subunit E2 [Legionella quateirensis]STY17673.1 branched-chain alpha-keto acid dehydrogenase subunit E2 [Legionella quateirensis]
MSRRIRFRKEALKQLSSPEQLDQLIQVVTPRSWIIAGTCYLVLFVVFLWSIFGSIPTRVEGQGILLAGGGDIYNAVAPDGPAFLVGLLVKPGDQVKKGQVVATLSRPDLLQKIKVLEHYLKELKNTESQLKIQSEQAIAKNKDEIEAQRASLKQVIASTELKDEHLFQLLTIRQAAFKKGIESRQNLEDTYQEYYSVKIELEGNKDKLVELDKEEFNFKDQWLERLRQLSLKITDETLALNNLVIQLKLSRDVISPINGVVTDIRSTLGSIINVGSPILAIASEGKGLDALVYFPPEAGKQIKIQMKALVSPTTVEKSEYGSIYGTVMHVAEFPSSSQEMISVLQNEELVKQFSIKEVPVAVRIHLQDDSSVFSGLKWSSSTGPKVKITSGTLVNAMITIREQPPITLVIPAFKKIWGLE